MAAQARASCERVLPGVHLYSAFGDVPIGNVNTRLLEDLYVRATSLDG